MQSHKILIIDDDETIKFSFKTFLNESNFNINFSKNGKEGLEKLTTFQPNLVIADYKMPEMTGLEFIKASKIICPNIPVIIMSAYGDKETKQQFLSEGASQYIEKPFDIEEIIAIINSSINVNELENESNEQEFIGNSESILNIFKNLKKIRSTNLTILIEGESGTGKDLIATYIHKQSNFSKGPFISINCAAIPENLIESELFGYEKGAFTGADNQKIGKFEAAEGGTLFLDEIGELPLTIQAKLLRILQNRTFERVGGITPIKTNVRIIAATNKSLQDMIKTGHFREDLYYRLATFPITIPALRERKNDIKTIANYLIKNFCLKFNKKEKIFSEDGLVKLTNYNWPGNVREMQNIISRITLLENSTEINQKILSEYFPKEPKKDVTNDLSFLAEYSEKELLQIHAYETFKACNFNKSETAKKLDINYRTLIKRLGNLIP